MTKGFRAFILQDARLIYGNMSFIRNLYRYWTIPAFKVTVRYRAQQYLRDGLGGGYI